MLVADAHQRIGRFHANRRVPDALEHEPLGRRLERHVGGSRLGSGADREPKEVLAWHAKKISSMFKKRNNPLPFILQLLAGAVLSPPLSLCHAPPAPHKYWKHREVVYFSAGSESAYVAGRESESARTPAAVALGPAEKSVLTPKPKKRGLERERGGGGGGTHVL